MTSPLKSNEHVAREPNPQFIACTGNTYSLTSHDRLSELAAILATGIHRLRAIHSALPECAQLPADSSQPGLDDGREFALMDAGLQPESEELDDGH